jgi:hypothetical protein
VHGTLYITGDPAADELLNADPLALLIGMLLDQNIAIGFETSTEPMDCSRGPDQLLTRR